MVYICWRHVHDVQRRKPKTAVWWQNLLQIKCHASETLMEVIIMHAHDQKKLLRWFSQTLAVRRGKIECLMIFMPIQHPVAAKKRKQNWWADRKVSSTLNMDLLFLFSVQRNCPSMPWFPVNLYITSWQNVPRSEELLCCTLETSRKIR